jgi:hypothetical protein
LTQRKPASARNCIVRAMPDAAPPAAIELRTLRLSDPLRWLALG